jgi:hypothetical protein
MRGGWFWPETDLVNGDARLETYCSRKRAIRATWRTARVRQIYPNGGSALTAPIIEVYIASHSGSLALHHSRFLKLFPEFGDLLHVTANVVRDETSADISVSPGFEREP